MSLITAWKQHEGLIFHPVQRHPCMLLGSKVAQTRIEEPGDHLLAFNDEVARSFQRRLLVLFDHV